MQPCQEVLGASLPTAELWGTQAGREMLTAYVRGRNLVWSGHLTKEKLQEQGVRDLLFVNPIDGYYSG